MKLFISSSNNVLNNAWYVLKLFKRKSFLSCTNVTCCKRDFHFATSWLVFVPTKWMTRQFSTSPVFRKDDYLDNVRHDEKGKSAISFHHHVFFCDKVRPLHREKSFKS